MDVFAGAVRADDGEELALLDAERHPVDSDDPVEREPDVVHFQHAHDNHLFLRL